MSICKFLLQFNKNACLRCFSFCSTFCKLYFVFTFKHYADVGNRNYANYYIDYANYYTNYVNYYANYVNCYIDYVNDPYKLCKLLYKLCKLP